MKTEFSYNTNSIRFVPLLDPVLPLPETIAPPVTVNVLPNSTPDPNLVTVHDPVSERMTVTQHNAPPTLSPLSSTLSPVVSTIPFVTSSPMTSIMTTTSTAMSGLASTTKPTASPVISEHDSDLTSKVTKQQYGTTLKSWTIVPALRPVPSSIRTTTPAYLTKSKTTTENVVPVTVTKLTLNKRRTHFPVTSPHPIKKIYRLTTEKINPQTFTVTKSTVSTTTGFIAPILTTLTSSYPASSDDTNFSLDLTEPTLPLQTSAAVSNLDPTFSSRLNTTSLPPVFSDLAGLPSSTNSTDTMGHQEEVEASMRISLGNPSLGTILGSAFGGIVAFILVSVGLGFWIRDIRLRVASGSTVSPGEAWKNN